MFSLSLLVLILTGFTYRDVRVVQDSNRSLVVKINHGYTVKGYNIRPFEGGYIVIIDVKKYSDKERWL